MKKTILLLFFVSVTLLVLRVENAGAQADPGLIKWMRDQDRMIQSNREMVNHEQKMRIDLENRLIRMLQADNQNLRQHINSLQKQINDLQQRMYHQEERMKKRIQ